MHPPNIYHGPSSYFGGAGLKSLEWKQLILFFLSFQPSYTQPITVALFQLPPFSFPQMFNLGSGLYYFLCEWMLHSLSCLPYFLPSHLFPYSALSSSVQITWKILFTSAFNTLHFHALAQAPHPPGICIHHFCPHSKILSILESSSQISVFHWNRCQCLSSVWLLSSLHLHSHFFLAYAVLNTLWTWIYF